MIVRAATIDDLDFLLSMAEATYPDLNIVAATEQITKSIWLQTSTFFLIAEEEEPVAAIEVQISGDSAIVNAFYCTGDPFKLRQYLRELVKDAVVVSERLGATKAYAMVMRNQPEALRLARLYEQVCGLKPEATRFFGSFESVLEAVNG